MSRINEAKRVRIVTVNAIILPGEKGMERINWFSQETALKYGIASEEGGILGLVGGLLVRPKIITAIFDHLSSQPASGKPVGAKSDQRDREDLR